MENKKLIDILVKDMSELEGLIFDIKESGNFNLLEMEFLQTKATGIRQLLQIFQDRNLNDVKKENTVSEKIPEPVIEPPVEEEEVKVETKMAEVEVVFPPIVEEIIEEELPEDLEQYSDQEEPKTELEPEYLELDPEPVFDPEPEIEISQPEFELHEPELELEQEESVPEPEPEEGPEPEEEEPETEPELDVAHFDAKIEEPDEVEYQEPVKIKTESQVLGETFQKERSVHDMVSDGGLKLEHKLSQLPIDNIKSSIGINDRFLFTRELFEGDPQLFNEAVTNLDNMKEIKEAVTYLRDNFKWKKNETSLKFVDLVKRRFMNE